MYGRFTISVEPGELAEVLGVESILTVCKRYNFAPSQTVLEACRNEAGKREAVMLCWGFVRTIGAVMAICRLFPIQRAISNRAILP